MLDNIKAREELKKYISKYNMKNSRIALKAAHIYRVADAAKNIAISLSLEEEQIKLAELIGLLHDIGRFEQLKRYDTFEDRLSVNHAMLGLEILKENNFIRKFCSEEKYYDIIFSAIENHNKYKIDKTLEGEKLLQAKIIRDADKIDILNLLVFETFETLYKKESIADEKISEAVLESFFRGEELDRKLLITNMDKWVSNIGYIFDLNFKPSFRILKEKDYINKIIDRVKTEDMEKVRKFATEFIENNC